MADTEDKRFRRYPQLSQLVRSPDEPEADWKRRLDRERKRLQKGYGQPIGAPKKEVGGYTHGESTGLVRHSDESDADWKRRRMREVMRNRRLNPYLKEKMDERRREIYRLNGASDAKKDWIKANTHLRKEYDKKYFDQHRDARLVKLRNWQKANPDRFQEALRKWGEENRHIFNASAARIRAKAIQATPAWADWKAIEKVYNECRKITRRTGIEHQVDHTIPLNGKNVCGLHVHYNLRVITKEENMKKRNRLDLSLMSDAA